ncbi:MAG: DUF3368 domain-containing protein [Coxiellaceae bacterium]|nr:DUF3368 domain-containing protein [Coxiellaceae bacterium]
MNKVIIADASPLIAFGSIDKLSILFKLFGKVVIPEVVAAECLADKKRPGAVAIGKAIHDEKIQIVHASTETNETNDVLTTLDDGEAAAIALAHSLNLPLIIDEKRGRDVAKKLGIKIIGTIGVLLLAKEKKVIKAIKPILLLLKNGHYFLSDALIKDALKSAKEK